MSAQQHYGLGAIAAILLAMVFTSLAGAPQGPVQKDAPGLAAKHQVLREALHKDGTTRVLVRLAVDAETLPVPARGPRGQMRRAAPGNQGKQLAQRKRALARAHQRFVQRHNLPPGQAKAFSYVPYAAVEVDAALLAELEASPDVLDITPDDFNELSLSSTLPVIGADVAQASGWDGTGYDVAILDTGVDSDHPMLQDNIVPDTAACYSNAIYSYDVSLCPSGFDQCRDSNASPIPDSACGDGAAEACGSKCGHGSHVAGIAAGNGSEVGVAPGAGIIPVNVFIGRDTDGNGSIDLVGAYDSDIIRGLEHVLRLAATRDIAAVNMSLGGNIYSTTAQCDSWESATKAVVDDLRALGVATVVAAGNNGSSEGLSSPGCISSVISVGSTDDSDNISGFSNESPAMTLHAPGESVKSAYPGGGTAWMSGTSMAAPHVAGAAAVLRQKAEFEGLNIGIDNLVAALQQTGAEMYLGAFKVPRLDVAAAAAALEDTLPVSVLIDNELHLASVTVESGSLTLVDDTYAYGGRALQGDASVTNRVRFSPTIPVDGYYRVSLIWPERSGAGAAINVDISGPEGVTYELVDQTQGGGVWQDLGVYSFNAGTDAFVELSDSDGVGLVADAVRLDFLAPEAVSITATALPNGKVGAAYAVALSVSGGLEPYTWAISAGSLPDGLSIDPATGVITGTPQTEGDFSFTVSVADTVGAEDQQTLAVHVEAYDGSLLEDTFADGDLTGWSVVDEGHEWAPSSWSVVSGELVQSTNINDGTSAAPADLPKLGTYAAYDGGYGWTDYRLSLTLGSDDDDAVGVMFRLQDNANYYRFSWDKQRSYRRLVKNVGGTFTLLAQDAVPYVQGQTYQLEILAQGDLIEVWINGALVFSVTDTSLAQGSIAAYSWGNSGARFDAVTVSDGAGTTNQPPSISATTATPTTMLETEITQLSVSATDPDAGPNPTLSYQWTASLGGGSFDDATSPTPVFTPPNVSATTDVTLTVAVSDGAASVTDSVVVTVQDTDGGSDLLLQDEFADGSMNGWTVIDDGTVDAPSAWSTSSGQLVQSTNIYDGTSADPADLPKRGSYAAYDGGYGWTDYRLSLTLGSDDDDAVGVMFRLQDNANYYRFSWDKQRGYRRLVKNVGGVFTLLAEDAVPYTQGQTYQLDIRVQGDQIEVLIDGAPIFSVTDASLAHGSIAAYSWGNTGAVFDDIAVTDLSGANHAPLISAVTAAPAEILDTESSQLAALASDPDDGPEALSYQWTLSPAAGSLDDPTSATPVFTPPDVAVSTAYTLTVEVSDGASTVSESVVVTVGDADAPPLLLEDDFADGDLAGWTVVDEGDVLASSSWSAFAGALVQSSNIYGGDPADWAALPKPGTYAVYAGGDGWSDYRTTLTLRSDDDDAIGLMFRVQDSDHYYRFSWDKERGYRRLVKNVGGVFTLLAEDAVPYTQGQTYQLDIRVQGDQIEVLIDGAPIFSVTDASLAHGSIAAYSWGNTGAVFDDIAVTDLSGANHAPLISAVTAAPAEILDTESSQLAALASDPDDGPEALSYQWTLSPAAGSLDDPTSATPVFTPPDVAVSTAYTLTVEVSDGASTVSESVVVTVGDADAPPLLLEDDFADGDLAGWTVVDEGDVLASSSWSAFAGALVQSSNIYGGDPADWAALPKPGTYAVYAGGDGWSDYRTTLTLRSDDDDAIGLMFRVQDSDHYYRFSWDKERGYRRLVKNVGGVFTLLAEDAVPYVQGQPYQLDILVQGELIEVRIDGALVFSVTDASLAGGSIAAYSWANAGAVFDDIAVTDLSGAD